MLTCLITPSSTFILSVSIIYFMIYPDSETDREEGKQESRTGREARPPAAWIDNNTQIHIPRPFIVRTHIGTGLSRRPSLHCLSRQSRGDHVHAMLSDEVKRQGPTA